MKKILMVACIFLLAGMVSTASATTVGNTIENRDYLDGATNIAFIDPTLVFPTNGTLESFSFWVRMENAVSGVDRFAPQIYRYTGTPDEWKLVYQNIIDIAGTDSLSITLNTTPFNIQAGDVLGWWFGAGGGLIPYNITGSDNVEWTHWGTTVINNPTIGQVYSFNTALWAMSPQTREYSISAEYAVPEPATLLLLGLGLVGLAGVRRKFHQ